VSIIQGKARLCLLAQKSAGNGSQIAQESRGHPSLDTFPGAVAASGATYLIPVVALVISWLAGEGIGPIEITAAGLIIASIALLQIGRQRAIGAAASTVAP